MRKLRLSIEEKRNRVENNFKKVFSEVMDKTNYDLDKMNIFLNEFIDKVIFNGINYPKMDIPIKTDKDKFCNLLEEYKFIKYTFYSNEYDSETWQKLMDDPSFYEKDEVYCKLLDYGVKTFWDEIKNQIN